MKRAFIFLLLFTSKVVHAQVAIDWSVCVEEKNYYYTNAHTPDFKKIDKIMRFCYNDHFFGFVHSGDNYLQIFPLELYNMGTDKSGNVTEGFCNGACPNYDRGDITVEITHSKPQRIWINYSRQPSYAICIYTNSLYVGKYKSKRQLKTDTLIPKKPVAKTNEEYFGKISEESGVGFMPTSLDVNKIIYDSTYRDYSPWMNYTDAIFVLLRQLIGQEIYILTRSKKYIKPKIDNNYYEPFFTAGSKYKILDMVGKKMFNGNINEIYFNLMNEENNENTKWYFDRCGYMTMGEIAHNLISPIMIVGYFEKLKNTYLNRNFIYTQSFGLTDKGGQRIENTLNSEWRCTKIALADYEDEPYQKITFILNNSGGKQIAIKLDSFKKFFIDKIQ